MWSPSKTPCIWPIPYYGHLVLPNFLHLRHCNEHPDTYTDEIPVSHFFKAEMIPIGEWLSKHYTICNVLCLKESSLCSNTFSRWVRSWIFRHARGKMEWCLQCFSSFRTQSHDCVDPATTVGSYISSILPGTLMLSVWTLYSWNHGFKHKDTGLWRSSV